MTQGGQLTGQSAPGTCWVVLFRGINVGGNNIVKMADLRMALEKEGFEDVATYIQSGNVVLRSEIADADEVTSRVKSAVQRQHGFAPAVFALNAETFLAAAGANPLAEVIHRAEDNKTVHVYFLHQSPAAIAVVELAALATASESIVVEGSALYLHAPDGVARSKLVARLEKTLGVTATGRNWQTITRLGEMLLA